MQARNLGEWSRAVLERDNYTCRECNKKDGRMEAHHILSRALYPELALSVDNGKTLCSQCHWVQTRRELLDTRQQVFIEVIRFRVTSEEKASIEAEAQRLGISVSAFLRLLIKQWSDGIKFERVMKGE